MWDLSWLIQRLTWADLLDIFLVALLFFWLFYALRGTRAVPLVRGIAALLMTVALLTRLVRLRAFSWIIQQLLPALFVAIPVLFQPELRRALERLGRGGLFSLAAPREQADNAIQASAIAARRMAEQRIGALIVFERLTGIQEQIETGVPLDALVTPELLTTLFDPHTVLHDGAVIIRQGRIVAAACVMPLTTAFLSDRQMGLRHRAAIGVTEESDAIALVVSEERGGISIAHNGRILRNIEPSRLESVLRAFFSPPLKASRSPFRWLQREQSGQTTPQVKQKAP